MTSHTPLAAACAPGARFIDPAALARIDNLELVARTVVDGFIAGLHRSPYLGLSLDFADQRPYMPGDDIRRIDWRVYARTDRYYVKQYEADTNANFIVALDASASMGYASGEVSKLDYGRMLAATLAWFASRQHDRVGLTAFADAPIEHLPARARNVDTLLHALDRLRPARPSRAGDVSRLRPPLTLLAEGMKRRGIVAVISDLYEPPEAVVEAIAPLKGRGGDVLVFHVLDPAELDFPFEEELTLEDLESGARTPLLPGRARAAYRQRIQAHIAELARRLGDERIDYAVFRTDAPLDEGLFAFLAMRQRMMKVR
ncbi:MAG TPA: DUF58 domain-containing protein [Longimicrobiales bacterium]